MPTQDLLVVAGILAAVIAWYQGPKLLTAASQLRPARAPQPATRRDVDARLDQVRQVMSIRETSDDPAVQDLCDRLNVLLIAGKKREAGDE